MTMKKDIGVAVIGTGYWGRNLVRNHHNLGHLTAICDTDSENLAKIVTQYPGLAAHRCLKDVLADAKVDAVVIATPAATHADIVGLALDQVQCLGMGSVC